MGQQGAEDKGFPYWAVFWWATVVFALGCVIMAVSVIQGSAPTAKRPVSAAPSTDATSYLGGAGTPLLPGADAAAEAHAPATDPPVVRRVYTEGPVELDARDRGQFRKAGFAIPDDFSVLADNCNDMEAGGDGMAKLAFESPVGATSEENLQDIFKALSIKYVCPEHAAAMGKGSSAQYAALIHASEQEASERERYGGMTREEWVEAKILVNKNRGNGASTGGGYSVSCNDGWVSRSGGKQGACSWHGGTP